MADTPSKKFRSKWFRVAVEGGATQYELQLAQLHQDRQRLSAMQSREGKGKLKVELLPAYEPYVEGVIEAGHGLSLIGIPLTAAPFFGGLIGLLGIEFVRAAAKKTFTRKEKPL